jgi:hypothetical protein
MGRQEFTDKQKDLLLELMGWFWLTFRKRGFLDFGVTVSDFDFLYSLWTNGVNHYDDKMKDRLNKIRDIYLKTKQIN